MERPVYFCGPTGCPANHFGDVILEAGWRHFVVGLVHGRVRIDTSVGHDAVDEVIDDRRDAGKSRRGARREWVETVAGLTCVFPFLSSNGYERFVRRLTRSSSAAQHLEVKSVHEIDGRQQGAGLAAALR